MFSFLHCGSLESNWMSAVIRAEGKHRSGGINSCDWIAMPKYKSRFCIPSSHKPEMVKQIAHNHSDARSKVVFFLMALRSPSLLRANLPETLFI